MSSRNVLTLKQPTALETALRKVARMNPAVFSDADPDPVFTRAEAIALFAHANRERRIVADILETSGLAERNRKALTQETIALLSLGGGEPIVGVCDICDAPLFAKDDPGEIAPGRMACASARKEAFPTSCGMGT